MRSKQTGESDVQQALEREGCAVSRWSNGAGAVYGVHDHPYHKVLVVTGGSITFTVGRQRQQVAMRSGDRLELPAGTPHSAVVGPEGVVCIEGQRASSPGRRQP